MKACSFTFMIENSKVATATAVMSSSTVVLCRGSIDSVTRSLDVPVTGVTTVTFGDPVGDRPARSVRPQVARSGVRVEPVDLEQPLG